MGPNRLFGRLVHTDLGKNFKQGQGIRCVRNILNITSTDLDLQELDSTGLPSGQCLREAIPEKKSVFFFGHCPKGGGSSKLVDALFFS